MPIFGPSASRLLREYDVRDHQHEGGAWAWQTWIMAILMLLICGGGQMMCCYGCIRAGVQRGDCETYSMGGLYTPITEGELAKHAYRADHEKIGHILRQEMRLMLLFPLIPLLAINQTSCEKGMPNWAYLLYIPFLIRAKWVEFKIMRALNEDPCSILLIPGFWLGCLEHADWFTDGALPVQDTFRCGVLFVSVAKEDDTLIIKTTF